MNRSNFLPRAAALLLTLVLMACTALSGFAVYQMPIQTVSDTESVYLFNLDTGKPILRQNSDQQRYIASLTKMMTALLFLESGKDMNAEITIPASLTQEFKDIQNANGSTMNLRIGETVRRIDLLYGLLVASANDAASVIASDVSGGDLTAFVARMNARAKELGCENTTFTCVHGLYDYGNVSTAEDLAKIAAACYADETYMQAANTLTYTLPATNLHQNERTIKSTNLMLDPEYAYYRDYIRGMKTGFTTLAGRCFVTFAQQDGHTYGLVVLGSDLNNIYRECSELLDWAFSSFADRPLVDTETVLTTLPLTKCRAEETVELYAANDLSGYGHADDEVTFDFSLPESAAATIKEGAVLGTATVYLDGYEMGTVDLVTHREYVSDFRTDAKTTLLLMAVLVGILIVLGFLTMVAGGGSLNLRRIQGGAVGAAVSRTRVPLKARSGRWVSQPVLAQRLAFFRFDYSSGIIKGEQPLIRASRASKVAGAFLVLFWHAKENLALPQQCFTPRTGAQAHLKKPYPRATSLYSSIIHQNPHISVTKSQKPPFPAGTPLCKGRRVCYTFLEFDFL